MLVAMLMPSVGFMLNLVGDNIVLLTERSEQGYDSLKMGVGTLAGIGRSAAKEFIG